MNAINERLHAIMLDCLNGRLTLTAALHKAFDLGYRGNE